MRGCFVRRVWWTGLATGVLLLSASGCVVPQPRGQGYRERLVEPTTGRGYWLYLPQEYIKLDEPARQQRRWPLVVTFHGMKPFDRASAQAREWEQEADRYGFIVIAPELRAPDVLRQFPVRQIAPSFKSDEEASLAIVDRVCATTHADPSHVLSTSWSSGGYLAHYMFNRYPERFTCLAVRQSNFAGCILDPQQTARSRENPLLILTTQNDFGGVKRETAKAIEWYRQHGYSKLAWVEMKNLGHERTPDMAAAFFAAVAGVEPNQPPTVLARRQAIAGNPRGLALLAGSANGTAAKPVQAPPPRPVARPAPQPTNPRATVLKARTNPPPSVSHPAARPVVTPTGQATAPPAERPRARISIRVSTAIGTEPLTLAFSAECPADWLRSADFLWTLDGNPVCSGVNGQKTITQPGEHTLGLLVVTRDGREHRAFRLIRVLPNIRSAGGASSSRRS